MALALKAACLVRDEDESPKRPGQQCYDLILPERLV